MCFCLCFGVSAWRLSSKCTVLRWVSCRNYNIDPVLLPLGNPIEIPRNIFVLKKSRLSLMGIVFGVYRNWIWEFGDLKSDISILWGCIWPSTTLSNHFFFALEPIVFGTQIRWSRGQLYLLFSVGRVGVCLWSTKLASDIAEPSTRLAPIKAEKAVLGTQHFEHLHNTSMASDDYDECLLRGALTVALVVFLTYEKRRRARILAKLYLILEELEDMETAEGEESEGADGPRVKGIGKSTHDGFL